MACIQFFTKDITVILAAVLCEHILSFLLGKSQGVEFLVNICFPNFVCYIFIMILLKMFSNFLD